MTATVKIHMVTGTRDHVACGGSRGKRTVSLADVTCEKCGDVINRMTRVEAHLHALEIAELAGRGRFESTVTTAPVLIREWLGLARDLAREEVKRAQETVTERMEEIEKLTKAIEEVTHGEG